jgi:hypothetical protein
VHPSRGKGDRVGVLGTIKISYSSALYLDTDLAQRCVRLPVEGFVVVYIRTRRLCSSDKESMCHMNAPVSSSSANARS